MEWQRWALQHPPAWRLLQLLGWAGVAAGTGEGRSPILGEASGCRDGDAAARSSPWHPLGTGRCVGSGLAVQGRICLLPWGFLRLRKIFLNPAALSWFAGRSSPKWHLDTKQNLLLEGRPLPSSSPPPPSSAAPQPGTGRVPGEGTWGTLLFLPWGWGSRRGAPPPFPHWNPNSSSSAASFGPSKPRRGGRRGGDAAHLPGPPPGGVWGGQTLTLTSRIGR